MMVRDVRETLIQILKEHYGLLLIHFSFIIDILSSRHCKSRWIHEIIRDISSLSARYLELNNSVKLLHLLFLYSDLFLYANKICWYLKKIKIRRKRYWPWTCWETQEGLRFEFEQCAKRLGWSNLSTNSSRSRRRKQFKQNTLSQLLILFFLTLWLMWMTLIEESLLDALVYIDCKEVWIYVQWERERERMV